MVTQIEGLDKVLDNLNKAIVDIKGRSLKGLIRGAIIIRRAMDKETPKIPVDTGNLRSSYFCVTSNGAVQDGTSAQFKDQAKAKFSSMSGRAAKMGSDHVSSVETHLGALKSAKEPAVIMGFSAYYAVFVHENVGAQFKRPGADAKFFEAHLKSKKDEVLKVIAEEAKIR